MRGLAERHVQPLRFLLLRYRFERPTALIAEEADFADGLGWRNAYWRSRLLRLRQHPLEIKDVPASILGETGKTLRLSRKENIGYKTLEVQYVNTMIAIEIACDDIAHVAGQDRRHHNGKRARYHHPVPGSHLSTPCAKITTKSRGCQDKQDRRACVSNVDFLICREKAEIAVETSAEVTRIIQAVQREGSVFRELFPLDRAGRLRGDVVKNAVDVLNFVADAAGDTLEDLRRKGIPVGGHGVFAGDGA